MRGIIAVGVWLTVVACTPTTTPPASQREGAAAAEVASATDEPAPTARATTPEPTAPPLVIGWSGAPPVADPAAIDRNREALTVHESGDFAASLAGFSEAMAIDPHYDWARFNAACAHGRLGHHAEAAALIRGLWLEDLPQFRARALEDEDLATTRASSEGAALLAELPNIEAAYAQALQRGAPAFTYRERSDWVDRPGEGLVPRTPYTDLRIGVYDPVARRFVAMVPRVERAYSGLLDREGQRALIAAGWLRRKDMWEVQPHRATVELYSLEHVGESLMRPRMVTPRNDVLYGIEARLGQGAEVIVTRVGVSYAAGEDFFRVTPDHFQKIGWTHEDVDDDDPPEVVGATDPRLSVIERAIALYAPTDAVALDGRTIEHRDVPGTILTASPGHHDRARVFPSPDPRVLVLASMTERFSDDGADGEDDVSAEARDGHVVDLVDFGHQAVTPLSTGTGIVHVAWAPDGTLLLETRRGVSRYEPGSTTPIHDVPTGIHFGTPPFPEQGGV